jgi:hypothetical protein
MAGVCAVDAHQRIPLGPVDLKLPRYRQSFRFARMHLVLGGPPTGDAMADAATVVEALREGRSYCGFAGLADARGVRFEVASAMTTAGPGESIAWTPGATLRVELPPAGTEARIRLYRDGVDVATGSGRTWSTPLERPGVYRIEAELDAPRDGRGWLPWILTNPVRVGV